MDPVDTPAVPPPAPPLDRTAIKVRQRAAWSAGDYARIGTTLQITGERLAEALALPPGSRVIDVAAGNGNVTLALARRWCRVMSTDYVAELLASCRERSEADRLEVELRVADAEALPFDDGEFDAATSAFGVMFTADHHAAARELCRVCRPGGRLGLASWTPEGFVGRCLATIARHVPPPAGLPPATSWGTRAYLEGLFGGAARGIRCREREFLLVYPSAEFFLAYFRTYYGPIRQSFRALDPEGQAALEADLLGLVAAENLAADGSMRLVTGYLESVVDLS
ncbi:MAG: methyltransferase domain-containing protein [Planctomycetes bacterium]|nr:methyltransferase domain-containing protein [Planctomycetota bacterium]